MRKFIDDIKNSKFLNSVFLFILIVSCLSLFFGCYSAYCQIILFLLAGSFVLFFIIPKPKSILGKLNLFFVILTFSLFVSFLGAIGGNPPSNRIIITNSPEKAKEIENFMNSANEDSNFYARALFKKDESRIYFNSISKETYNNNLIKLAESNLIDNNVKYIGLDTLYTDNFKTKRKRLQIEAENITRQIDGVKFVKADSSIWENENEKPSIILNVEIYNGFNQEKIEKTIKNIFVGSNLTLKIKKAEDKVSFNWHEKYDNVIHKFWGEGQYQKALQIVRKVNEKAKNTYNENCIGEMILVENKIKKDPKNYKFYIERAKLKAPVETSLFSNNQKKTCNGFYNDKEEDTKSAITDFETALKLNPKAYEIYEPLYIAYKLSAYKNDDKILEYAIKTAEYNKTYYDYYEVAKIYKSKKDNINKEKYLNLAKMAFEKEAKEAEKEGLFLLKPNFDD